MTSVVPLVYHVISPLQMEYEVVSQHSKIKKEKFSRSPEPSFKTFSGVFHSIGESFSTFKNSVTCFYQQKKMCHADLKFSNELKERVDDILSKQINIQGMSGINKIKELIGLSIFACDILSEINVRINMINEYIVDIESLSEDNRFVFDVQIELFNHSKEVVFSANKNIEEKLTNEIQDILGQMTKRIPSSTGDRELRGFKDNLLELKNLVEDIALIEEIFISINDFDSLKIALSTEKRNLMTAQELIEIALNEVIDRKISAIFMILAKEPLVQHTDSSCRLPICDAMMKIAEISKELSSVEEEIKTLHSILILNKPIQNEGNYPWSNFFSRFINPDDFILIENEKSDHEDRLNNKKNVSFVEQILKILEDHIRRIEEYKAVQYSIDKLIESVDNYNCSRKRCVDVIKKIGLDLTADQKEKFQNQLDWIQLKNNEKLEEAMTQVDIYLKETLMNAIQLQEIPRIVFQRLLLAAKKRLEELELWGGDVEAMKELLESHFLELNREVTLSPEAIKEKKKNEAWLKQLNKEAALNKKNMGVDQLNSRQLTGEQVQRIPEKLMRQLTCAQEKKKLTSIDLTPREMQVCIQKRGVKEVSIKYFSELISSRAAAVAHMQGDRPTQEDAHVFSLLDIVVRQTHHQIPLYGIFDGHGGKDGAAYLANTLARKLQFNLQKALMESCDEQEDLIAIFNTLKTLYEELTQEYRKTSYLGGSTACNVLIYQGLLIVANLGDSRAFINVNGIPIALSEDASIGESQRDNSIKKRHGLILNVRGERRVMDHPGSPTLNMTNSACEKNILSVNTRPKIIVFPLHLLPPGSNQLVIGCDGVFDAISTVDAASTLHQDMLEGDCVEEAAIKMVKRAYDKGSSDNISALIVALN